MQIHRAPVKAFRNALHRVTLIARPIVAARPFLIPLWASTPCQQYGPAKKRPIPPRWTTSNGCSSQGGPLLAKRFLPGQVRVPIGGGLGMFWHQCVGLSMLMWIEGSNVAVGWAKQELWACLSVTFSLRWAPLPAVQKRLIGTPKTYPAPAGWNKKNFDLSTCPFSSQIRVVRRCI